MNCPIWILPAFIAENLDHWILYIIDWKNEIITCIDSLGNYDNELIGCRSYLPTIRLLMNSAYQSKHRTPLKSEAWTVYFPTDIEKQRTSYDCGLHVLFYCEVVCRGHNAREFSHDLIEKEYRNIVKSTILMGKDLTLGPNVAYSKKSSYNYTDTSDARKLRSTFKNISTLVPLLYTSTIAYLQTLLTASS
jgi:hypothetical protein